MLATRRAPPIGHETAEASPGFLVGLGVWAEGGAAQLVVAVVVAVEVAVEVAVARSKGAVGGTPKA